MIPDFPAQRPLFQCENPVFRSMSIDLCSKQTNLENKLDTNDKVYWNYKYAKYLFICPKKLTDYHAIINYSKHAVQAAVPKY